MEFLSVSENKLKITLSSHDCLQYGINTSDSDFSTNEIKLVVRSLLEIAKEECGFSAEGEKILAQLYPMPDGSCELFITKLSSVAKRVNEAVRDVEGMATLEERRGIYMFSDAEDLIAAARAIYREGIDCDLYFSDEGLYYISIREDFIDGISEFEILTEYGERLKTLPIQVISEYGRLLCKGKSLDYILQRL